MSNGRILLTGAFGNVGANALIHATAQGYEVLAFDLKTPVTERKAAELAREHAFEVIWGDLSKADTVRQVTGLKPDAIVHVAAIIAPLAYVHPGLARAVNVDGTRYLIEAAHAMPQPPKFVFTSSYSVHGPRNPYRDLPPLTGETPVNPSDTYGRHKVKGEDMLRASNLDWTIVRLPAVLATDAGWGQDPAFMRFAFLLPLDRREHVLDSRDAALALVNAVSADATGRTFDVGGPHEDCRITGGQMMNQTLATRGLGALPESAFRMADPEVDESWYYEDWVDTTESQAVLKYQQHNLADYLDLMRRKAGIQRYILPLISGLVTRQLLKDSPYLGKTQTPDAGTVWQAVVRTFNIPPEYV